MLIHSKKSEADDITEFMERWMGKVGAVLHARWHPASQLCCVTAAIVMVTEAAVVSMAGDLIEGSAGGM